MCLVWFKYVYQLASELIPMNIRPSVKFGHVVVYATPKPGEDPGPDNVFLNEYRHLREFHLSQIRSASTVLGANVNSNGGWAREGQEQQYGWPGEKDTRVLVLDTTPKGDTKTDDEVLANVNDRYLSKSGYQILGAVWHAVIMTGKQIHERFIFNSGVVFK
jgi:hypothetical protein